MVVCAQGDMALRHAARKHLYLGRTTPWSNTSKRRAFLTGSMPVTVPRDGAVGNHHFAQVAVTTDINTGQDHRALYLACCNCLCPQRLQAQLKRLRTGLDCGINAGLCDSCQWHPRSVSSPPFGNVWLQADGANRRTTSTELDSNNHRCTPLLANACQSWFYRARVTPTLALSKEVPNRCR